MPPFFRKISPSAKGLWIIYLMKVVLLWINYNSNGNIQKLKIKIAWVKIFVIVLFGGSKANKQNNATLPNQTTKIILTLLELSKQTNVYYSMILVVFFTHSSIVCHPMSTLCPFQFYIQWKRFILWKGDILKRYIF